MRLQVCKVFCRLLTRNLGKSRTGSHTVYGVVHKGPVIGWASQREVDFLGTWPLLSKEEWRAIADDALTAISNFASQVLGVSVGVVDVSQSGTRLAPGSAGRGG